MFQNNCTLFFWWKFSFVTKIVIVDFLNFYSSKYVLNTTFKMKKQKSLCFKDIFNDVYFTLKLHAYELVYFILLLIRRKKIQSISIVFVKCIAVYEMYFLYFEYQRRPSESLFSKIFFDALKGMGVGYKGYFFSNEYHTNYWIKKVLTNIKNIKTSYKQEGAYSAILYHWHIRDNTGGAPLQIR